mmetsp:Transcript_130363/g.416982  ORF Transcript_130363/g.416982 Transcript_130363/m.416982 type:complete len:1133 (-) Transcript_130363:42-3440(-)
MKAAANGDDIGDGWFTSLSRACRLQSSDDGQQTGTLFDGCFQKINRKVSNAFGCGGEPLDGFNRAGHTTLVAGKHKTRRHSMHAEDNVADLTFDLPSISEGYRVIDGQSLGVLKLAIHKHSHQRRAICPLSKRVILEAHPGGATVAKEEVMKRLQTLLKLDHVNVLALHEACEDAKNLYLIYDWPEGGLLLRHLTQYHGDVTEAHMASVFREVLGALAAAARFKLYHHDWSLMCLFLGYKNRFSPLKVFGIGLAGAMLPLVTNRSHSRSNKHFYCSPELFEEQYALMTHKKLHACDIWSVGTLLYTMFSGRPPFCGGKHNEVVEKIKKRHWAFGAEFDTLSRESKDVIEKMLDRGWETRPSASSILGHPFLGLEIGNKRKQGGVVGQDTLSKLDHFARETHCKQTLARLLADLGLQESAYSDLEDQFKNLDLDGNGVVEVTELEELSGKLGEMDGATIATIITACDRNGNGTIDISEFVAAIVLELESKDEKLLMRAFDQMDMNRDARITKGEIFRVLRQYSGTLETADVSNFVGEIDKDADQKIDYNEFKMLFPHIREKDEAIKARIRGCQLTKETQKKTWNTLLAKLDNFLRKLRLAAIKITLESVRIKQKGGQVSYPHIAQKVKKLEKVLSEFAEKGEKKQNQAQLIAKELNAKHLTGLALINTSLQDGDRDGHAGEGQRAIASQSAMFVAPQSMFAASQSMTSLTSDLAASPRAGRRGASPREGASPRDGGSPREGSDDGSDRGGSPTAGGNRRGKAEGQRAQEPTVAEPYIKRAMKMPNISNIHMAAEVRRLRKYFWMGSGDGLKHMRTNIYGLQKTEGQQADGTSPRSGGSGGSSPRSSVGSNKSPRSPAGSATDSPRQNASPRAGSPGRGLTPNRSIGVTGPKGIFEKLQADHGFVAWSKSEKQLKECEAAMGFAAGAQEMDIGDELCDLAKVLKHKCLRTWLPWVMLILEEMDKSLDEQKVHLLERQQIHTMGMKLCVQLVERIMFSLMEFILWQEEVLQATWTLEDVCPVPPASKRVLPFRPGEVEENARTPRDEQDAERLAPDIADPMHTSVVGASTDGEMGAVEGAGSRGESQSQSMHISQMASFATSSKRLTRSVVRSTIKSAEAEKLQQNRTASVKQMP